MDIEMRTPGVDSLGDITRALSGWQREDAPIQLHPGDLGWNWRSGAAELAASLRTWNRNGSLLAVGFLDGPDVLRLTVAPEVWREEDLARRVVADVSDPERGVLAVGSPAVEVPDGTRVKELLSESTWGDGESWTPLRRVLAAPVAEPDVRTEVVTSAAQISECTAVHRSAWGIERFTDEVWHTMSAGLPFTDARCLLARDGEGLAVATVTVWSAGPGRPGLIEPLGVHIEHRRRGYGAAICVSAAMHLRQMGSSSVVVCTPSSLHSAIATYESAGFRRLPERLDKVKTPS